MVEPMPTITVTIGVRPRPRIWLAVIRAPSRATPNRRMALDENSMPGTQRPSSCSRWGYFNFNHHEPKAPTAKVTECGHACHLGGAKKDEVWTQFYPLLDK